MKGVGRSHPLFDTIERLRRAYISLGFDEVVNPIIIGDADIYKQWGPEAPVILDRCYYLAVLPRPDVGMSDERVAAVRGLGIAIDEGKRDALQRIFHRYKKADITSEELAAGIAAVLGVSERRALEVLDRFPELRRLRPSATRLTIRSHMTSGWFLTLRALQDRRPLPIRLFSIDRCFRREQREDETHLRTHHSASCVLMDGEAGVEAGEEVARGLLRQFGIAGDDVRLVRKRRSASYYEADTETEVFARYRGSHWVEVADFGVYAAEVLDRYEIRHPVMNLGLGAERLAMLLHGIPDIRQLVYPQFYAEWVMPDDEIARLIRIHRVPRTEAGRRIAQAIIAACERNGDAAAPCEFVAYRGSVRGRPVTVIVREREEGKRLLGPAALNEIVVFRGNVIGMPSVALDEESALVREARRAGVRTGIRYLDGVAHAAAAGIEDAAAEGEAFELRVPIARTMGDVNVAMDDVARRYVTSKRLRVDVRGPVFIDVVALFGEG